MCCLRSGRSARRINNAGSQLKKSSVSYALDTKAMQTDDGVDDDDAMFALCWVTCKNPTQCFEYSLRVNEILHTTQPNGGKWEWD